MVRMPVFIHDIATSVPETFSKQDYIREQMKKYVGRDRKSEAIIHRIYSQSGIEKRHTVVDDFQPGKTGALFFNGQVEPKQPSTATRNRIYEKFAKQLFVETGRSLLNNNSHISSDDITHVITASCTGFFAPGPDYEIVKQLGLKPTVQRFHIGFMGCYAAFPALKMAEAFCKADPDAVVLLVCTEICTLHFQAKNDVDNLLSASVFSDGAAGAIVSQKASPKQTFEILDFASSLTETGEKDMAWIIGDTGFDMVLSTYVPDIIKANLSKVISPLLDEYNIGISDVDYWALHPGGRSIVDKIQDNLDLKDDQVTASREVLAEYGNMSSATVLFVLKKLFDRKLPDQSIIMPMAFGPGLTIESGLLKVSSSPL